MGFDRSAEALVGAVIVDTQADFLPPVRVEKGPFVAYERPQDVAYISNLAVLPATRRRGVGERLLAAAEKVRGTVAVGVSILRTRQALTNQLATPD